MIKFLCKIGIHPDIHADRCGLKETLVDDHYDPDTGEPIKIGEQV